MNKSDVIKSVVGVLGFLFGVYNLVAARYGWAIIQFDSAAITTAINSLITVGFGLYSTWKNCNITPVAKDLQNFKNALKSGDLSALKDAYGVIKEIKEEAEKNFGGLID